MNFIKGLLIFGIGHFFGAIIATMIARHNTGSWSTGPSMVALSIPVTLAYFLGLWILSLLRWPQLNVSGLALAGFVCAVYPAFCGVFPVYNFRLGIAIPLIAGQFIFIVMICAIFSRVEGK